MIARAVNAAADVIHRAQANGTQTATGLAMALESAQLLVSPELAHEMAGVEAERDALRARVAELEAERAKYVGKEPTIAEEMAYLSRCIDAVLDLCGEAERKGITSGGLFTVEAVRKAADGLVERTSYPPTLPWARLLDAEDLHDFLGELADAAIRLLDGRAALAEVERTCATWRLIAEAQHAHNTAPGPEAPYGVPEGRADA